MRQGLILLVCAVGFLLFLSFSFPVVASVKEAEAVMAVTVVQAKNGTLYKDLEVYGKAVPRDSLAIETDLLGVSVVAIHVEAGDTVAKGQVLALLDKEALQYSLDSLQADLVRAESELTRAVELLRTRAISREERDQRRATCLMLRSQVADARLRLQKASVIAPADGLVYRRNVDPGVITQPGRALFEIAARGEIEFEAAVPEGLAYAVMTGAPASITLLGQSRAFPATVRLVFPEVTESTRTVGVRLACESPFFVPVGSFCTARFRLAVGAGAIIPITALHEDAQGYYVWGISQDDFVNRLPVALTARNNQEAVVTGIAENQPLVAKAGAFLQEGDRILRAKVSD